MIFVGIMPKTSASIPFFRYIRATPKKFVDFCPFSMNGVLKLSRKMSKLIRLDIISTTNKAPLILMLNPTYIGVANDM